ncbi:DUF6471 domain-containing protein [Paraburkholderia bannensis]|uniref:DUF6471 domain-containing protein n=1 Tax=Paraburkholderia bannensis TaxID=765414 RepID=UPI002AAFF015|nr:DUF6471 domain-containing protein [Paraburkholderia bannensis]
MTTGADVLKEHVYGEWEAAARNVIVSAMNDHDIGYKELALRLEAIGISESADQLNRKVNRRRFSAAFMLACLAAIEGE